MVRYNTLLVCSASRENRKELRDVFGDVYHLLEAENMDQARLLLKQNMDCIASILLDITDMKQEDLEWIGCEKNRKEMGIVPVIVLSDRDTPEVLNRGFSFGAADVIPMGYDAYAMLRRVEIIIDLHLHKQHLETLVAEQKNLLRHNEDTMVDVLSSIIEYRSVESGQHIYRIRRFTRILLEEVAGSCPEYQLDDDVIAIICSASALHDIGKIAIPDAVLMKPGRLTEAEREIMKTHSVTGCRILESLSDMADQEYLRYACNICRHHHERWDGGGYPDGLRGEEIPLCAQVVGLVDVFDALTSKRVYKDAYPVSEAVDMIFRGECGAFSPRLLNCLKNVLPRLEDAMQSYSDEAAVLGKSAEKMPSIPDNRKRQGRLEQLQEKLQRYEVILAQTENVLFDWDIRQDTISFSGTWEKIFGYTPIDRDFRKNIREGTFVHPDDAPLLLDKLSLLESGSSYEMAEVRIATSRGRYLWCRFRGSVIRDARGMIQKVCGIILNIDAEKQAEQALQSRAERDSLTKLLNKNAARRQAEEYLSRYPEGVDCALMIIDLDDFKGINDQYGHLFGDTVLTRIARNIRRLFRGQDIVARIGGDEFMVLMRGVSDERLLNQRCSQLIQMFSESFSNSGHPLTISCSIGIAAAPYHGRTYVELFRHADQALYRAKARGKNCYVIYNKEDAALQAYPGRTAVVSNPIDSDREPGLANDNFVRYAFQKLYSSQDVEKSVNELLDYVGRKMNVSRVYVFENSEDNRFCTNTYEWCNEGIAPEISNLQNISYEADIPGFEDNFDEQGIFYCPDVNILPPMVYDIVAPQGIKSMLQCAIRENGVFRGYIGFDECREHRMWTKEQISLLTYFSESLSMFLLRERRQGKVRQQADELQSILDNQNAWIYIIDPETFRLKYINARLKEQKPDLCVGVHCYQALRGRDQICPQCPAARMAGNTTAEDLQFDACFNCHVLMESTRIRWEGQEACLLSGRKLQGLGTPAESETKTETLK